MQPLGDKGSKRSQDYRLEGAKLQIKCNDVIKIFRRGTPLGQRYRRIKYQKPWPGLALKQDFAKERGLKSIVKKVIMSNMGDVLSKLGNLNALQAWFGDCAQAAGGCRGLGANFL